ncbi:MAG: DUF5655 domain-containing protein [Candidatus Microgenomates bacterium]
MLIYKKLSDNKLIKIKEKKIDLEKNIQSIIENNLSDIFDLQFISSEFSLNNLRIDTLTFDEEAKAFVIIEYKKDKNFSVIDQGYAYLSLLLNNKADFVLEYNEKQKKNFNKNDIDWSQSKIIFIAQSFTKYQQEAIGFQDLPIELWEVKIYENDILILNQIKSSEKSESIKTIQKSKDIQDVSKEIRQYSIEDHIKPNWEKTKELFEELSQKIIDIDSDIEIYPVRSHIAFKLGNKNLINIVPGKSKIRIDLLRTKPEDVKDLEKKVKYLKNSFKYWNQHVSVIYVSNSDEIDYAITIIKQVYKRFKEL